jgi:hypothetical protein
MAEMCLNIVTSWRRCWVELCELTNTSTTSTTFETTTDLKTLSSCLSKITDASTHLTDPTSPDGLSSIARIVDGLFGAALLSWRATRELTAIAPATSDTSELEPIVVARKPFPGTVAANVLKYGTGALNIDATRIEAADQDAYAAKCASVVGLGSNANGAAYGEWTGARTDSASPAGRWPANVVLDEDQAAALDQQSGTLHSQNPDTRRSKSKRVGVTGMGTGASIEYADSGGASRFYFCAKAPKRERPIVDGVGHPTVKPLTLMRWLCRLVTPPGGLILDPFAGSGATLQAGMLEGFRVIGIESDPHSVALIRQRLSQMPDDALPFDDDGEVVA